MSFLQSSEDAKESDVFSLENRDGFFANVLLEWRYLSFKHRRFIGDVRWEGDVQEHPVSHTVLGPLQKKTIVDTRKR